MTHRKIFFLSLFTILIIFSALSFSSEIKREDLFSKAGIQAIKSGKKAPNFRLEDLKGKKVELKHFKGKVVFLNFWATWCGPCKEEMPSMEFLYNQFKEKDFVFLAISADYEGVKPVKEFIEKQSFTFPVLIDPKYETLDLFEVKGIPTTFLIDKKGIMIGRAIGPKDWKRSEVISILNLLIEK
jgi:cytochrome c biogenesis protein CcmG/thiol:disulfide interchange protein DsbE